MLFLLTEQIPERCSCFRLKRVWNGTGDLTIFLGLYIYPSHPLHSSFKEEWRRRKSRMLSFNLGHATAIVCQSFWKRKLGGPGWKRQSAEKRVEMCTLAPLLAHCAAHRSEGGGRRMRADNNAFWFLQENTCSCVKATVHEERPFFVILTEKVWVFRKRVKRC